MKQIPFRLALILALSLLQLAGAHLASAADQVVSDCGDNGLQTQLRFQLELAQQRDDSVISFTCKPGVTLAGGELPTIATNVTINGGHMITLSGNNASRLFYVTGSLTLRDITITKGYAGSDGGAIKSYGTLNIYNSKFLDNQTTLSGNGGAIMSDGVLNITSSEFAYNKAANGGALYPTGGTALTTITGSNFHHNETMSTTYGWGGAIYMSAGASVTINSSSLSTNQARSGGAVYVYQTSSLTHLTINNNTLSGNDGGGIYNNGGTATLTNVTLSGNNGGGIRNDGGTATLTNVTLSGNHGGGIYNNGGTATLTNVTLSGNSATDGGGIFTVMGTVTLTNVTLSGNSATDGGGIFTYYGTATLTNVTLSGNSANRDGGGIITVMGTATLTNVTLSGNSATRDGGGIYNSSGITFGTVTLTNVTLSGNSATRDGGGIYNSSGTVTLINVTLSGNDGGGIVNDETASLKNTLIAKGTRGVNCAGLSGGQFNLSDDTSCNFAAGGGRDNVTDLLLGPLANNGGPTLTHMPQPGSPAIDGGAGDSCPATDQRGASRVGVGTACDVGSVEYGAMLPRLYLPFIKR